MDAHDLATDGDIAFFHPYRVRWADVDPQGIVFNPNYFVFFDDAWNEYLRAAGFPYPRGLADFGIDFVAVHNEAIFRSSARFDDQLRIGVRLAEFGRSSLKVLYTVWRGDVLLNEGRITYVAVARATGRPLPVPEHFRHRIRDFEITPPLDRARLEA